MKLISPYIDIHAYSPPLALQKAWRVATNPSVIKKVLKIAAKVFSVIEIYSHGETREKVVTKTLIKGSIDFIEVYGIHSKIQFWINPFSKETLDSDALLTSLKSTMEPERQDGIDTRHAQNNAEQLAQAVFQEVMQCETLKSEEEVRNLVIASLNNYGVEQRTIDKIANGIIIQQQKRPIPLLVSMVGLTTVDVVENFLILKKWGIAALSLLASQIGNQAPIFSLVVKFSVDTVFGTIESTALIVTLGEAAYRAVTLAMKRFQSEDAEERAKALSELRVACLDMVSRATDLADSALTTRSGKQFLFGFVVQFSVDTLFGTIESIAFVIKFGEATYRVATLALKSYQLENIEDKEKAKKELRDALLDMLLYGTNLIKTAAPLFFVLDPPVLVALALVAKTTGLVCVLVKQV